jgi:hypothetical protein
VDGVPLHVFAARDALQIFESAVLLVAIAKGDEMAGGNRPLQLLPDVALQ